MPGESKVGDRYRYCGPLLREIRLRSQQTLNEFAERLGISASNLCDLESGRRIPSPKRAVAIARKLGVSEEMMIEVALEGLLGRDRLYYRVSIALPDSEAVSRKRRV